MVTPQEMEARTRSVRKNSKSAAAVPGTTILSSSVRLTVKVAFRRMRAIAVVFVFPVLRNPLPSYPFALYTWGWGREELYKRKIEYELRIIMNHEMPQL